jgi:hypothetical protein
MKNPKFTPLAILILAIVFVTGCTAEPVEVVEDQAEEPVVVEEEEVEKKDLILPGGYTVTPECQEICLDRWMETDMNTDYNFDACYILCEEGEL